MFFDPPSMAMRQNLHHTTRASYSTQTTGYTSSKERAEKRLKDCVGVGSMGTDTLDRDLINAIFLEISQHLVDWDMVTQGSMTG
jgi:hypothetical protein